VGLASCVTSARVFDDDGGIFQGVFQSRTQELFNACLPYGISDHRPTRSETTRAERALEASHA